MSKLKNIEELDELFKKGLEQAEVPAPPEVWTSLSGATAGQSVSALSKLASYFSSMTNVVKVALFVGGIGTAGYLLYDANTSSNTKNTDAIEQPSESDVVQDQIGNEDQDQMEDQLAQDAIEQLPVEQLADQSITGNQSALSQPSEQDPLVQTPLVDTDDEPVKDEPDPLSAVSIQSMSQHCCLGETRTFNTGTTAGNWYVNGQLVKSNSAVMSHRFTKGGKNVVSFRSASGISNFEIEVKEVKLQIVNTDLGNGQYQLSLANDVKVIRWLIKGVEMSRAQSFQPILKPGKHHIAVEASSGECTFISEQMLEINPKGSFSSPDIFTPNNDNDNETYFVDIKHYESFAMKIVQPSTGQIVFQTTDPNVEWNGRVNNTGEECPSGQYAVRVEYTLIGQETTTKNIKLTLKRD